MICIGENLHVGLGTEPEDAETNCSLMKNALPGIEAVNKVTQISKTPWSTLRIMSDKYLQDWGGVLCNSRMTFQL